MLTTCDLYRLQDDIRGDPWINIRAKKYMAGPKRVPFKNKTKLMNQYRTEYLLWFALGAGLSWPFAVVIGRRAMTS